MWVDKETKIVKSIIEKHNGKYLSQYTLVSNYGYIFEYKGKEYDARHWLNVYGASVNFWNISPLGEPLPSELSQMEDELNEMKV